MKATKMNVGIYHIFEANRKAILKELDNGVDFGFEEIDHWRNMETSTSEIIVIFSPEFLPSGVSIIEFKDFIRKLNKTLIIVAYDIKLWWIDRTKTFYVDQPDEPKTMNNIVSILALEKMGESGARFNLKGKCVNSG